MKIQTDITTKDLIDFTHYHMSHSPTAKRQKLLLIFLPGLMWSGIWIALSAFSAEPLRTIKSLMPLIMGGPLSMIGVFVLWRWSFSRQIQKYLAEGKNKGVTGPQRITISSDGVADINELSQFTTRWDAVEIVAATDDCIYIYVNALSAVIVPKRFFPNDTAFTHFFETAKEYHAQATS